MVTVITGGSAGIGAATARELARRGHAIVLAARTGDRLAAVAAALTGPVKTVIADVTRRGDVERIRDEALAAFGHVINVSSFLARVPLALVRSAYSAAKAAVNSLGANLRMDLAQTHPAIHVTTVMPGIVATEFAKNARGNGGGLPAPGVAGAGPAAMAPQTAEAIAAVIAGVIETPVAEVYTNPASPAIAKRYFDSLRAFEALS